MASEEEIDRLARLFEASENARSDDYLSPPGDYRQTLLTVAFAVADARGHIRAPHAPPEECLPILWLDDWEESGRPSRVLAMLRCLVRFYSSAPIPKPRAKKRAATRARKPRAAGRARRQWRELGGERWRWREERELLEVRLGWLGITPREALAALHQTRHARERWCAARDAYLRAVNEAAALILDDARSELVSIWGARLGERLAFGDPEKIPLSNLMQDVAIFAKLNAVKQSIAPLQRGLSRASAEFRECFISKDEAAAVVARHSNADIARVEAVGEAASVPLPATARDVVLVAARRIAPEGYKVWREETAASWRTAFPIHTTQREAFRALVFKAAKDDASFPRNLRAGVVDRLVTDTLAAEPEFRERAPRRA